MRKAFTLIELLVVISIIALLVAILLPALSAARKSAQDIQCLTNQKQEGVAFHVYATENKGDLLVGSASPNYQGAYWLTRNRKFVTNGLLIKNPGIEEPQLFYCPRQTSISLSYDTQPNPWLGPGTGTRSSFVLRPFDEKFEDVIWVDNKAIKDRYVLKAGTKLPRFEDFESDEGLMSDATSRGSLVDSAHEDGINAIRVDGSGRYVDRTLFDQALPGGGSFSKANNPAIRNIWQYAVKKDEIIPDGAQSQ